MSRSKWKGFYCNENLLKCFNEFNKKKKFFIFQRNSIIDPIFLGTKVAIYNGKIFINIFIDENKIGYKFGEFAFTRKKCVHKKKNKKK